MPHQSDPGYQQRRFLARPIEVVITFGDLAVDARDMLEATRDRAPVRLWHLPSPKRSSKGIVKGACANAVISMLADRGVAFQLTNPRERLSGKGKRVQRLGACPSCALRPISSEANSGLSRRSHIRVRIDHAKSPESNVL